MSKPLKKEKFKIFEWCGEPTDYAVGTNGSVYNLKNSKFVKQYSNEKGYMFVNLTTKIGGRLRIGVHRLVALTFIPNPENKPEVNHLDAVRDNNNVNNLEWVTHQENIDYAVKIGNVKRVTLEPELVHKICKMLQDGITPVVIAELLGLGQHIIRGIKSGKYYPLISKEYNIPKVKKGRLFLTEEEVHKICKLRQEGFSNPSIAKKLDLNVNTVSGIFRKSCWNYITSQYTFQITDHEKFKPLYETIDELLLLNLDADEIVYRLKDSGFDRDILLKLISRRRCILVKNGHPELQLVDSTKWKHLHPIIDRMLLDGIDRPTIFHTIGENNESIRRVINKRYDTLKKRGEIVADS